MVNNDLKALIERQLNRFGFNWYTIEPFEYSNGIGYDVTIPRLKFEIKNESELTLMTQLLAYGNDLVRRGVESFEVVK